MVTWYRWAGFKICQQGFAKCKTVKQVFQGFGCACQIDVESKIVLQTSSATGKVAQSMDSAAKAMAAVGQANDPKAIQKIMQEFSKENMKMDMTSEMMDDALDSAFDTEDAEDEADDVMNQVWLIFDVNLIRILGSDTTIIRTMTWKHC